MELITETHRETVQHFVKFYASVITPIFEKKAALASEFDVTMLQVSPFRLSLDNVQEVFPWLMFLELSVIMFVLSWAYRLLIATPVIKLVLKSLAHKPQLVTETKVVKFAQAHLEMVSYSIFAVLGGLLIYSMPWFLCDMHSYEITRESKEATVFKEFREAFPYFGFSIYWWTNQPNNRILTEDLVFFYVLYAARYVSQFISVFLEPKRKDFWEMQLHHLVTAVLVILSYKTGYVKYGLVIMLLMDLADPFLHLAKQFIYLREVSKKTESFFSWGTVADICFVLFTLVFTITRVVMYPFVVWSSMKDPFLIIHDLTGKIPFSITTFYETLTMKELILVVLLCLLLCLQLFWFGLLMKIVISVIRGEKVDDNRSDSEGESEQAIKKHQ